MCIKMLTNVPGGEVDMWNLKKLPCGQILRYIPDTTVSQTPMRHTMGRDLSACFDYGMEEPGPSVLDLRIWCGQVGRIPDAYPDPLLTFNWTLSATLSHKSAHFNAQNSWYSTLGSVTLWQAQDTDELRREQQLGTAGWLASGGLDRRVKECTSRKSSARKMYALGRYGT
ncbi:hypothetical protein WOLCODRAFT_18719 [Wolfiporia cocos MD-104 SS10]|uniref:Uncharacterized protein n=1 Tax=Wolfiporia cocos (strain MD-104) TaxID=742152 RepID=A0A2H3JYU1_WOLCO|nr:hypothetical protein WOLCODRAFT_18719 [Wolfiporia cocos MD-104 SS10]